MENTAPPTVRLFWIDALRGIAALAIVVFHYHHFYLADAFGRPLVPPIEAFPYASILVPLYSDLASHAVELFWLISGFVFAHVYLPRPVTGWAFSVARFARLYPLHLATLLYVAAIQAVSMYGTGHWQVYGNNDVRHFLLQLFMSSDWTTLSRGLSYNGPIWSVSLEIVVYGMFFVSLFTMRRNPLVISSILCLAAWTLVALAPAGLPLLRPAVFVCAGYFFLGSLLYTLRSGETLTRFAVLMAAGIGALALGAVMDLEHLAIAGCSVAMLSIATGLDRVAPAFGARLKALGDISYSVYLVHIPLQMTALLVADLAFGGTRAFADHYLTLPIYVGLSVLLAHIAHRWLERPAGKAIRTWLLRSPRRQA